MAPRSVEVHVRVSELESVRKALASAGELAEAAETFLARGAQYGDRGGELAAALRDFKATLRAQSEDTHAERETAERGGQRVEVTRAPSRETRG